MKDICSNTNVPVDAHHKFSSGNNIRARKYQLPFELFCLSGWKNMKEEMNSTFQSFAYGGFWINIEAQEFNPVTHRGSGRRGERGWMEERKRGQRGGEMTVRTRVTGGIRVRHAGHLA